jgi:hypothetical protein
MKQRLTDCARAAEELVPLLLALAPETSVRGEHADPRWERAVAIAIGLRSDLHRLLRYADLMEE